MERPDRLAFAPGASVLGGAAGGLSYEGTMRDAMAADERSRRLEAGQSRALPRVRTPQPEPTAKQADH